MYYSQVLLDIEHPLLVKDQQLSCEQRVVDMLRNAMVFYNE